MGSRRDGRKGLKLKESERWGKAAVKESDGRGEMVESVEKVEE